MKIKHRLTLGVMMIALGLGATGCGKADELVMVTTEQGQTATLQDAATTTEDPLDQELQAMAENASIEEIAATEEASESEKNITFADLYAANRGDVLLANGNSFSMNTIYYAEGVEVYSEYQFLGFDESGNYIQVYEDSDGFVQILDNVNNCWYIYEEGQLYSMIYPEPYVAGAIIESNHNAMIFGMSDGTDGAEYVQDIFRQNGELIVETKYNGSADEGDYIFQYVVGEDLKVLAFTCYDESRTKLSYSWVTHGSTYTVSEDIKTASDTSENYRTVVVKFSGGEQMDTTYYLPVSLPLQLRMLEYTAYADEACTTEWAEEEPTADGTYGDVTIYMKK